MGDQDPRGTSRPAEVDRSPPFVGRERELAELRALFDRSRLDGAGGVAVVTGPAGVGKSRLLAELARRLRAQGVPTFEGACRDRGVVYQSVIELAQAALSHLADLGAGGERLARAAEVVAALRGQGSLFGGLRRGRRATPLQLVRDGGDQRLHFFEQVRLLFADATRARPAIFLVHDLHLADGATGQLLAYLARTLAPAQGLAADEDFAGLLVFSTQEGPPSWTADTSATTVRLEGLDLEAVRAFLSSEAVVRHFHETSGGVPRLLEALLEQQPRHATDLLADRLGQLSRPAARLCRALAVYGRPAGAALLERLAAGLAAEDDEGHDRAALELRACPLLIRSVVGGELRLGFAHSADREAVAATVPDGDRVALHRALGEALLVGLEAGDDPAACAEHLLEGQAGDRAVEVTLTAGETLERSFAYERAIALYLRALAATTRTEVIDVLEERLADLYQLVGDYGRALEVVGRMAARRPDPATLGRVGHLDVLRGDLPAARAALAAAQAAAEEAGDLPVQVQVLADLAETHFLDGAHEEALRAGRAALELGQAAPDARRAVIAARNSLGKVYLEKGDYGRADAHFADNLADAQAHGLLFESSRAHINCGICALRRGDSEGAEAHYRAGLAAAREHGDVRHRAFCLQNLGVLAQWRRDYGAALRYYQDAVSAFKRLGHRPWLAWVALDLGDLYLGLGDEARAASMVALADRLSVDVATTSVIRENLRGRLLLHRGDPAAARRCLEAALEVARRIDNKDELSITLLHLARVELSADDPDAALDRLGEIPAAPAPRVQAQLLVVRGEARLVTGQLDLARVDLAGAERAFAELADDEGRLRALLHTVTVCDRAGDPRAARAARQLARDLDERLRARVPVELAAGYGREPARQALLDREPERPRLVPARPADAPAPARPRGAEAATRAPLAGLFAKIVGRSASVVHVLEMVERVAPHDSLVLIRGESGTGKELVAEAIHEASPRKPRPFVKVNCGALVETLLLSELFGHERGAFTGALQRRKGRFELADGGTLFLDEIGDISPPTQVALLRVLQTHEFERVGGTQPVRVDVRIVCATNRDLEAMVSAGRFREDLYYRLKGIEIELPPLRARPEDLPDLVRHFLARIAEERHTTAKDVTPSAMEALMRYPWPGNIRELENVIRSVTLFADGQAIDARDLIEYIGPPRPGAAGHSAPLSPVAPAPVASMGPAAAGRGAEPQADVYSWAIQNGVSLRDLKRKIELDCITQALAECGGNITRAAERLGMKRPRLSQLLKEHGLSQGRPGTEDKL